MSDFKIITGNDTFCQKVLNQWKHQFELEVLYMCVHKDALVILLVREKKGVNDGFI